MLIECLLADKTASELLEIKKAIQVLVIVISLYKSVIYLAIFGFSFLYSHMQHMFFGSSY